VTKQYPTLREEHKLRQTGHICIAGIDEAGRGAWAGPVSAAAVILPVGVSSLRKQLDGVCDSKLCTPRQRDVLYGLICESASTWGVSLVPASRVDEIGIVPATRQAMREALTQLHPAPDALLIDALHLPGVHLAQRALIRGDRSSLSIAAASILAKVTRDRAMVAMAAAYPGYGFAAHKGYGTRQHREALQRLGPTEIHRWYFAPVAHIAHQTAAHPPHPVLQRRPRT
jgi:ribonuclease HII